MPPNGVSHADIMRELGELSERVRAEATARQEFRSQFDARLVSIEVKVGDLATKFEGMAGELRGAAAVKPVVQPAQPADVQPASVTHAVLRLLERQPLLGIVFAMVLLGLGSGGLISLWEAFARPGGP